MESLVSGNTVVLEVTWKGTHQGPLATPNSSMAGTGRRIIRSGLRHRGDPATARRACSANIRHGDAAAGS